MQDDHSLRTHDTTMGGNATARDISDAIPRGRIFRATEPVVAPVAPAPTDVDGVHDSAHDPTLHRTAGVHGSTMDPAFTRNEPMTMRPDYGPGASPAPVVSSETRRVGAAPRRRFSIGATFLGWAVASFFSLVFTALLLAFVGGVAADANADGLTGGELTNIGVGTFVGLLVAMFLAYLIGGYAAGRIGHWDGAKHGAAVPAWTILFALIALLVGASLADTFNLGAYVGGLPAFDADALGGYGILAILLMLLADFAGAILGGILGARGDQSYEGFGDGATTRRRTLRGRPL